MIASDTARSDLFGSYCSSHIRYLCSCLSCNLASLPNNALAVALMTPSQVTPQSASLSLGARYVTSPVTPTHLLARRVISLIPKGPGARAAADRKRGGGGERSSGRGDGRGKGSRVGADADNSR